MQISNSKNFIVNYFCREKKSLPKRIISTVILTAFIITNHSVPGFAITARPEIDTQSVSKTVPADLSAVVIPETIGKIDETYLSGQGEQVVFLVQDAHAIPDAQRNIQELIHYLNGQYGVSLVGVEGASAQLDTQIFKSFPDKQALLNVMENHRESGELAGSVSAAIFDESNTVYHGIEDWNLYEQGSGWYLKALDHETELLKKLDKIAANLQKQKEAAYSKKLIEVDAIVEGFYADHNQLLEVLNALSEVQAPEKGSELAVLLEHASKKDLSLAEKELKNIAKSVEAFLTSLPAGLKANEMKIFRAKEQGFKTSQLIAQEFGLYLTEVMTKYEQPLKMSKELKGLLKAQKRIHSIEGSKLFKEFESYIGSVKQSLFRNPAEAALDLYTSRLRLVRRFASLKINRDDWEAIKVIAGELPKFEKELPFHFGFYKNTEDRDEVFAKRTGKLMKRFEKKAILLMVGGFHADSLTREFERSGISFIKIQPQINFTPEQIHYRDHMKGEVSWKNYFKNENGKLYLYKAFIRYMRDRLLGYQAPSTMDQGNKTRGTWDVVPGALLRSWRDQIIRDLAARGKVASAYDYTRFIDETLAARGTEDVRMDWIANIKGFAANLGKLDAAGQLTVDNVFKLLKPATIAARMTSPSVLSPEDTGSIDVEVLVPDFEISVSGEDIAAAIALETPAFEAAEPAFAGEKRSETRTEKEQLMRDLKEELIQKNVDEAVRYWEKNDKKVAIMMEDIAADVNFEVEKRLNELGVVTMHDDMHGTAIIAAAAALNGLKKQGIDTNKPDEMKDVKIVMQGAGASAVAVAELLLAFGVGNIIMTNSREVLHEGLPEFHLLDPKLQKIIKANKNGVKLEEGESIRGTSKETAGAEKTKLMKRLLTDANGYIGLSAQRALEGLEEDILGSSPTTRTMRENAFVFALANPYGEFNDVTLQNLIKNGVIGSAAVGAFNRKVEVLNNSSAFPGWNRGMSDAARDGILPNAMTPEMLNGARMEAAKALAALPASRGDLVAGSFIKHPTAGGYDAKLTEAVAKAVYEYLVRSFKDYMSTEGLNNGDVEEQLKNIEKRKNQYKTLAKDLMARSRDLADNQLPGFRHLANLLASPSERFDDSKRDQPFALPVERLDLDAYLDARQNSKKEFITSEIAELTSIFEKFSQISAEGTVSFSNINSMTVRRKKLYVDELEKYNRLEEGADKQALEQELKKLKEDVLNDPLIRMYLLMRVIAEVYGTAPVLNKEIMGIIYSPVVGEIAELVRADMSLFNIFITKSIPEDVALLVGTDTSAILGYKFDGIMGEGGLAIMDGKATLISGFGGVITGVAPFGPANEFDDLWRRYKVAQAAAIKEAQENARRSDTREAQQIYFFGGEETEGRADMKEILGGKGANLAEMALLDLPVPPGFTITTKVALQYIAEQRYPDGLDAEISRYLEKLEAVRGKRLGDPKDPLLLSVRSGAKISMPGMMDTILNIGLNDETVEGLAEKTGNRRFAFDSYRRLIQMFGETVNGIEPEEFADVLDAIKAEKGVAEDTELTEVHLAELVERFKEVYRKGTGVDFPQDTREQLNLAIKAVFDSSNADRAKKYREINNIPDDVVSAVNVQSMVFGNTGEQSATGVAFTRDNGTGAPGFNGDFLINAQGEDVVAGIRTPMVISELEKAMPGPYKKLHDIAVGLEKHYKDMQDLEFTIEDGTLWMLQTRNGKRSATAMFKIAVDLVNEGIASKEEALLQIDLAKMNELLNPIIDPEVAKDLNPLTKGAAGSPGAAVGRVVFNSEDAEEWKKRGEKVILVRRVTSPDDLGGMAAAEGILTAEGGATSHAAVVAKGQGYPAVVGAGKLQIDIESKQFEVNGTIVKEGDWITINGSTGDVYLGQVATIPSEIQQVESGELEPEKSEIYQAYSTILEWADEIRTTEVWANVDTPEDAARARKLGAQGIGLARTEHMFIDKKDAEGTVIEERLLPVQTMLLSAEGSETRDNIIDRIGAMQKNDFAGILEAMKDLPVTIRLLDPPIDEFMPSREKMTAAEYKDTIVKLAERLEINAEQVERRVESMREANPMMGTRGVRLLLLNPSILRMQVRSMIEAYVELQSNTGIKSKLKIMVPNVVTSLEFSKAKEIIEEEINKTLASYALATEEAKVEIGADKIEIGSMIETPAAVKAAEGIARLAEFFSFGTNDLTQFGFAMSREDAAATLLPLYKELGIFPQDPTQTLQPEIAALVEEGTTLGRQVKPGLSVGCCGEHGGDPASIQKFLAAGLDYVSASPLRLTTARIASAQAQIKGNVKARSESRIQIREGLAEQYSDVYTPEVLMALDALSGFNARQKALMEKRNVRRKARQAGKLPIEFLDPESIIPGTNIKVQDARDGKFEGAVIPEKLQRQWIQGTGPAAKPRAELESSIRNVAYALLSGADGWMFDGEDALGQVDAADAEGKIHPMSLENQRNLKLAISKDPVFMKVAEKVAGEMNEWSNKFKGIERDIVDDYEEQLDFTTKIFRARGLHLDDRHVRDENGVQMSASIVDAVLYVVNNYKRLLAEGSPVALYLPKIQTAEEAALWNDILSALENHLGLPEGTIVVYVLVEQLEETFQLMETRAALGKHFVGFNTGRWDYINSVSDARAWDEKFIQPDIEEVTMTYAYMAAYEDRVRRAVNTPDINGNYALWQGGMEPNIPVGSPEAVEAAMKKAVAGATREENEGASGKWVAHWKMVHIVRPVWEKKGKLNQLGREFPRLTYTQEDADALTELKPARRSIRGARNLISVALQYGNAFSRGFQAAALKAADFFETDDVLFLMEDMATGEIRLSILWDWIHKGGRLTEDDPETGLKAGDLFTMEIFEQLLAEEYQKLLEAPDRIVHDDSKVTTLPIAREVVEAYVSNEIKFPWYIDLLNINLNVEDLDEGKRRIALYIKTFIEKGERITQNLDTAFARSETRAFLNDPAAYEEEYRKAVDEVQAFMDSERFKGIVRPYTAVEVVDARGIGIEKAYPIALKGSVATYDHMRANFEQQRSDATYGPYSGGQVVTMKRHGIALTYVGGWAKSADGAPGQEPGADVAGYPLSDVPDYSHTLVGALVEADRIQSLEYRKMSPEERARTTLVDYTPMIIADADTGHGGETHVRNLVRRFIERGVAGYHIEDQKCGAKKCGHQGGKVEVSANEQIKRLTAARFQADLMGVPGLIVGRTDAEAATLVDSDIDEVDQPFIYGATNLDIPPYRLAILALHKRFYDKGITEIKGFDLYARLDEEDLRETREWFESKGLLASIDKAIDALLAAQEKTPVNSMDYANLREKAYTAAKSIVLNGWQESANVKTRADALADVVRKRNAKQPGSVAMTVDEWNKFTAGDGQGIGWSTLDRKAKELGLFDNLEDASLNFVWSKELPRSPEGFFQVRSGLQYGIAKGLAQAPFADLIWMETKTPDIEEAKKFADAIHAQFPDKMLAYNLSPSFNWDSKGLTDDEMRDYVNQLGKLGYVFNFITYAGHQIDGLAAEEFSKDLVENGPLALARVQRRLRLINSRYVRPQNLVGGALEDLKLQATTGHTAETDSMGGASTDAQHKKAIELPPTVLEKWLDEWNRVNEFLDEGQFFAELAPTVARGDELMLNIVDPNGDKVAHMILRVDTSRDGQENVLVIKDMNVEERYQKKRLTTLMHLFLLARFDAKRVTYFDPNAHSTGVSKNLVKLGIFENISTDATEFVSSSTVNAAKVTELVDGTDSVSEGLVELIAKKEANNRSELRRTALALYPFANSESRQAVLAKVTSETAAAIVREFQFDQPELLSQLLGQADELLSATASTAVKTLIQRPDRAFAVGTVIPDNMDVVSVSEFLAGYLEGLEPEAISEVFRSGASVPDAFRTGLSRLGIALRTIELNRQTVLKGESQTAIPLAVLEDVANLKIHSAFLPVQITQVDRLKKDPDALKWVGKLTSRALVHLADLSEDASLRTDPVRLKEELLKRLHLEDFQDILSITAKGQNMAFSIDAVAAKVALTQLTERLLSRSA